MTTASRLVLLGVATTLVLAACGSSSSASPSAAAPSSPPVASTAPASASATTTPAPATPAPATVAPSPSTVAGTACGQDLAAINATMKAQEHYTANGTMNLVIPMSQADPAATPLPVTAQLVMAHQKPDSNSMTMQMTMPGIGDFTSKTIGIGTDEWADSQGTGTWVHRTVDKKSADESDMFTSLSAAGLEMVDPATLSGTPDVPGTGCLIAFAGKAATSASPAPGGLDLTEVQNVLFRIGSDGRVQSAVFLFDPQLAATGSTPAEFTLVFDYDSPVSIAAPDPATVTEESPAP